MHALGSSDQAGSVWCSGEGARSIVADDPLECLKLDIDDQEHDHVCSKKVAAPP